MAVKMNEKLTDNQVILPPDSSVLDTPTDFSVTAWVYYTEISGVTNVNEYLFIIPGGGLKMYHESPTNVRYESFILTSGTPGYFIARSLDSTLSGSLMLNTWTHLAGTYATIAASNNLKLYVSGLLVSGVSTGGAYYPTATWIPTIGGAWNGTGPAACSMADVRAYNRELSAAEVLTIANGYGNDDIQYGLLGRWMLNEGYDGQKVFESTSGIFKDMGPYGLHGTAARL